MATVSVRYIVDDVDAAIDFYTSHLGFAEVAHPDSASATLSRGDLRLALSAAAAVQAARDGRVPGPGGWNRICLQVTDLPALVGQLQQAGVTFRHDIVKVEGGRQILLDDPAGNPVELVEPDAG